jgi:hypothetical protein
VDSSLTQACMCSNRVQFSLPRSAVDPTPLVLRHGGAGDSHVLRVAQEVRTSDDPFNELARGGGEIVRCDSQSEVLRVPADWEDHWEPTDVHCDSVRPAHTPRLTDALLGKAVCGRVGNADKEEKVRRLRPNAVGW